MKLFKGSENEKTRDGNKRRMVSTAVFALGLILVVFAARELMLGFHDDVTAQAEYEHLRELSAEIVNSLMMQSLHAPQDEQAELEATPVATEQNHAASTSAQALDTTVFDTDPDSYQNPSPSPSPRPRPEPVLTLLDDLAGINPDFAGWIIIPGTTINYPIARGQDNYRYLRTTFSGTQNPAGAIFMDYRNTNGFDAPVCMVYGHNMRDDSMFSQLTKYFDSGFMDINPEIIVMTVDGDKLVYRIFAVRRTDALDGAYSLDINDAEAAPEVPGAADPRRILALSTCLGGSDRSARFLVFAALEASDASQ